MSKHDTVQRQLALLSLIPRAPGKRDTGTLCEKLKEEGFQFTERTLQRDLQNLSVRYPLVCDTSSKPYRWQYVAGFASDLPASSRKYVRCVSATPLNEYQSPPGS